MKINYISLCDESIASYRYRIEIPGKALVRKGHEVFVSKNVMPDMDVAVFSKHFDPTDPEKVKRANDRFIQTVFDMCDLHMGNHRGHYERMLAVADTVTVPTQAMADELIAWGRNDAIVIPEPYEHEESEAKFNPQGDQLKLLWFGHGANLPALFNEWENIKGHFILVLTSPDIQDKTNIAVQTWTPETMLQGLYGCDAVLIPVENKIEKRVKSANRMVESIRRGRFVIASDTPSHSEFKEWMWAGDIKEGIAWTLAHKDEIVDRVKAAQEHVRKAYNPEVIAEKWEAAFDIR